MTSSFRLPERLSTATDAYHGSRPTSSGRIDRSTVLTLVVQAPTTAARGAPRRAAAMPDARFVAIPGCGHLPMRRTPPRWSRDPPVLAGVARELEQRIVRAVEIVRTRATYGSAATSRAPALP
jgi:pimeloyl-ACP methyl ester carboxylesterase